MTNDYLPTSGLAYVTSDLLSCRHYHHRRSCHLNDAADAAAAVADDGFHCDRSFYCRYVNFVDVHKQPRKAFKVMGYCPQVRMSTRLR
jgi:hypothetical protein